MNENTNQHNQTLEQVSAEVTVVDQPITLPRQRPNYWRVLGIVLYWFKIVLQPAIAVAAIVGLVFAFAYAQQLGYFTNADSGSDTTDVVDDGTVYFCPMNCVQPMKSPGRCPVCGMELKARKLSGNLKDYYGLTIDPAARRLSGIKTVVAAMMPMTKEVMAFGRISFDETSEAQIPAYVDGRIEKMFVDFTGAEVKKGEELALLYSADLYSAQVEFLESKKAIEDNKSTKQRIIDSNQRMFESARKRLIEFGFPESRIDELERTGQATRRIRIVSPISGTITEKLAVELDYVKTGNPLFKVVDLTKVWLMVELFPKDAGLISYGQQVNVTLQSQPGKKFQGRVAFVDQTVNPNSQTIPVRVVIPNESGLLRIGDYAEARILVDITARGETLTEIYDPDLAGKWISPKHPYIIRDEPGKCPECGIDLVPASDLGFVSFQPKQQGTVAVPRQSVLISGQASVAYVETKPGRFEFRKVEIGPVVGDLIAIISGIKPGEHVVAHGAFMLDAEFNQSSKPSLIDPNRAAPEDQTKKDQTPEQLKMIDEAFTSLSPDDRKLAEAQEICPVTEYTLGTMGSPIKIAVDGRDVFICCESCRNKLVTDSAKYFAVLDQRNKNKISPKEAKKIADALASMSAADRKLVEAQVYCPVTEFRLGSMGTPIKLDVKGQPIFVCCTGCTEAISKEPDKHLALVEKYKNNAGQPPSSKKSDDSKSNELPRMELPKMELPKMKPPKSDDKNRKSGGEKNE